MAGCSCAPDDRSCAGCDISGLLAWPLRARLLADTPQLVIVGDKTPVIGFHRTLGSYHTCQWSEFTPSR
jgi:hypothetical protein